MKSLNEQKTIQFWKLKTFNDKLNASIAFLQVHWKPLLKANAVIAGPLFVLGVGLLLFYTMVFLQKVVFNPDKFTDELQMILSMFFTIFISGTLYMISLIGITLVTFEYIRLAQENSADRFNTKAIFKNCKKRFWKVILAGLFSILILFGLSIVANLVSLPLMFVPIIGVIIAFVVRMAVNFLYYSMLYIYIPMSYYEKIDVTKAFGRSKDFVLKDFWPTTGMYLGNKAIQYVLANGVLVPIIVGIFFYLIRKIEHGNYSSGVELFTKDRYIFITMMLVVFVYLLVNTTFNIFHILSSAVQYFSLKEKNDGDFNFKQIEQFETLGQ